MSARNGITYTAEQMQAIRKRLLAAETERDALREALTGFVALWPKREDGSIKATPEVCVAFNAARAALAGGGGQ